MNIKRMGLIVNDDMQEFYNELHEAVENWQGQGLTIEVQYSTDYNQWGEFTHSALVIGRK